MVEENEILAAIWRLCNCSLLWYFSLSLSLPVAENLDERSALLGGGIGFIKKKKVRVARINQKGHVIPQLLAKSSYCKLLGLICLELVDNLVAVLFASSMVIDLLLAMNDGLQGSKSFQSMDLEHVPGLVCSHAPKLPVTLLLHQLGRLDENLQEQNGAVPEDTVRIGHWLKIPILRTLDPRGRHGHWSTAPKTSKVQNTRRPIKHWVKKDESTP
ncbi:hypothetical protein SAY86_021248 [Trapa natans]|uniref:Uncharacterized protein n=1 Tax=Trapa natans TaxID=22666 RepID=A0AAN7RJW4_TRANT|nr:hypothetical protein SAY86_021248 [Trapa natans]